MLASVTTNIQKMPPVTWSLSAGDVLFEQDAPSATLYVVKQGVLKGEVTTGAGKTLTLDLYGEGDLVGLAALAGGVHLERAVALSACWLEIVHPYRGFGGAEFRQLYADALGKQLRRAQEKLLSTTLPADARLCAMFLELGRRFGHEQEGRVILSLPLTHDDVAGLIHTSRPTASAAIDKLRERSALEDGLGMGVFLLHPARLEQALDECVLGTL